MLLATFKCHAITVFFLLSFGALASEPALRWNGHEFREVGSLSDLPAPIRLQLGAGTPGLRGVADKGSPFNASDVVDTSKPMRRLLAAGQAENTWLVAIEQGGRGYNVRVYWFSNGVQQQSWVLLGRPDTLLEVIQELPGKASAMGAGNSSERTRGTRIPAARPKR